MGGNLCLHPFLTFGFLFYKELGLPGTEVLLCSLFGRSAKGHAARGPLCKCKGQAGQTMIPLGFFQVLVIPVSGNLRKMVEGESETLEDMIIKAEGEH